MNRTEKKEAVEALGADLAQSSNAILFGFAGLKVPDVTELRRQVRGAQSKYLVVKNTLALRATKGTALEAVSEHFVGPTAVVYNQGNPVGLAKVLTTFAKTNPNLVVKAAVIEGRAVAAEQVKALAEQNAKATGEIGQQISSIQAATQESVNAIREISGTIEKLSEISSTIAAAVEEQGAATQEISRNVQQAAQGTQQVSSNVTDVQRGATETGTASSQVLAAAKTLSTDSGRLKSEVSKFLTDVRAT